MSGQYTQWWLSDKIIAYASSKDGRANCVISKAQFDNALPKNRTDYDIPLGIVDASADSSELAAARALLEQVMPLCVEVAEHATITERIRAFLKGGA